VVSAVPVVADQTAAVAATAAATISGVGHRCAAMVGDARRVQPNPYFFAASSAVMIPSLSLS
jgi:hypothetical protein